MVTAALGAIRYIPSTGRRASRLEDTYIPSVVCPKDTYDRRYPNPDDQCLSRQRKARYRAIALSRLPPSELPMVKQTPFPRDPVITRPGASSVGAACAEGSRSRCVAGPATTSPRC